MSAALNGKIGFGIFVAIVCYLAFLKYQDLREQKNIREDKQK